MKFWQMELTLVEFIFDFMYMSTFILIGTAARRYIKFFQKFLIPNNLIGGLLALIFSTQVLGWIDLPTERLTAYIYHLLALTFIALGLRQQKTEWGKGPVSKSFAGLTIICLQATIGILIAFALFYTIKPDLFLGVGLLLPLGFAMGPGLAASMGGSWEQYGFEGGSTVGVTFAAIGFLYAYFAGMTIINWGIKTRKSALIKSTDHITVDMLTGVYKSKKPPVAGHLPLSTEAIEPMAFHLGLIGFVYLLTYGFLKLVSIPLANANLHDFVDIFWSFHFVFGLIIAIIIRKLIDISGRSYVIDKGLMTRGMGVFLDYLIVGAIAAISIKIIGMYWEALLIMSLVAGPVTFGTLYWICWRAFDNFHFERFVELFGEFTGTTNSGLILLRVLDPEFETPVAEDAVYGSGLSLFIGLPLLFSLGIPMQFFNNSVKGYWITLGIIVVYWIILTIIWKMIGFLRLKRVNSKN